MAVPGRFKRVAQAFDQVAARVRVCESSGSEHSPAESLTDLLDLVNSFLERDVRGGDGDKRENERDDCESDCSGDSDARDLLRNILSGLDNDDYRERIYGEAEKACRVIGNRSSPDLKRRLMARLREKGFDAGLCKSKWERNGRLPSGDYEYVDVNVAGTRYIVEAFLAGEFEIARPTDLYASLLDELPPIFVGKAEELKRVVRLMCSATKESMKTMEMHMPPWRRYGYVQAKWFGLYKRTTSEAPLKKASDSEEGSARKRAVGFAPLPAHSYYCRGDFVSKAGFGVGNLAAALFLSKSSSCCFSAYDDLPASSLNLVILLSLTSMAVPVRFKRVAQAFDQVAARVRFCESSGSEHSPAESLTDLSDLVNSFLERDVRGGAHGEKRENERDDCESDCSGDSDARDLLRNILSGLDNDDYRERIYGEAEKACRVMGNRSSPDFKRRLMARLREKGFDAGLCKSRWERNGRLPSGDYEYVDVNVAGTRYIVDVFLAGEFEIARPTDLYASLLDALPPVFVGEAEELKRVVRLMCSATKESMKTMEMHVPPWRRYGYVQAKWFGSYKRTTSEAPLKKASDSEEGSARKRLFLAGKESKRAVGFAPLPANSYYCRVDFDGKTGFGVGKLAAALL
ncbi:hypothetical protein RJ640_005722 [Escallonia rubra]|uniref:DUF506 family protein n=1 Tax=Escallonia rubra TaxID=112253 RepID=A0AA88UNN6_9ASTE|nr:hypothetical protein RJ640_005722 [Escallonia rubra]